MQNEFEMSIVGELSMFLGIQIKQLEKGISVTQAKYVKNMLKTLGIENAKHARTAMNTSFKFTKDEYGKEGRH